MFLLDFPMQKMIRCFPYWSVLWDSSFKYDEIYLTTAHYITIRITPCLDDISWVTHGWTHTTTTTTTTSIQFSEIGIERRRTNTYGTPFRKKNLFDNDGGDDDNGEECILRAKGERTGKSNRNIIDAECKALWPSLPLEKHNKDWVWDWSTVPY